MKKHVVTAGEVEAASGQLVVPSNAIITPWARDIAAERGIEIVREGTVASPPTTSPDLVDTVRALVMQMVGEGAVSASSPHRLPVKHAKLQESTTEPFPFPGPPAGMEVRTGDVVTEADGAPVAAGYMTMTKGEFPWTLNYDEVQVILEGELHLGTTDGVKIGRPGDVLFVPKGSTVTFATPSWTKFVYVTFPVNWEG